MPMNEIIRSLRYPLCLYWDGYVAIPVRQRDLILTPRSMHAELCDRAARGEVRILDSSGADYRVDGWCEVKGQGLDWLVALITASNLTAPMGVRTGILDLQDFRRKLADAVASRFALDDGPEAEEGLDLVHCVQAANSFVEALMVIKSRLQ